MFVCHWKCNRVEKDLILKCEWGRRDRRSLVFPLSVGLLVYSSESTQKREKNV